MERLWKVGYFTTLNTLYDKVECHCISPSILVIKTDGSNATTCASSTRCCSTSASSGPPGTSC